MRDEHGRLLSSPVSEEQSRIASPVHLLYVFRTVAQGRNIPSAGIGYNLILARPMPPPSIGKASFMRGHFDHRINCSSTKHKEGLR
jgi:hypothetical protein